MIKKHHCFWAGYNEIFGNLTLSRFSRTWFTDLGVMLLTWPGSNITIN